MERPVDVRDYCFEVLQLGFNEYQATVQVPCLPRHGFQVWAGEVRTSRLHAMASAVEFYLRDAAMLDNGL